MKNRRNLLLAATLAGLVFGTTFAEPSKNFKVFLCFGQSNMSGGTQVSPDAESKKINPRVKVLAFADCSSPSRKSNTWSDASEPMHCGDGINSMGPSYAFGQMLADSLSTDTIGLIPCGQWGVKIEYFMKGGNYSGSKPSTPGGTNVYQWMLTKCKEAVKRGVFSGIILEQGESNSGEGDTWLTKVKTIYTDLKKDIPLDVDVPFVAGELLQASGNCCAGHNTTIAKIPQTLPLGFVASSKGLAAGGDQKQYHFDQAGYRTLGQRMAIEILKGLKSETIQPQPRQRVISTATLTTQRDSKVYSLDGRFVSTGVALKGVVRTSLRPGNLYVVAGKSAGASVQLMVAPTAR